MDELLVRVSEPESPVSLTIGRVLTTLFAAPPKKLRQSISRLSPKASLASLDDSLWYLHNYVKDAAQGNQALDEILLPMIQSTLRSKDSRYGGHAQAMILLNWLFQDEHFFQLLARELTDIIVYNNDRYLALGWCILVRCLVEYENNVDGLLLHAIREKHPALLKMLSSRIPHLYGVVRGQSISQVGNELPSRLSVSAADCLLSLSGALAKKAEIPLSIRKPTKSNAPNQPVALLPTISNENKVGPLQTSVEVLNPELEYLLCHHLEELVGLVQCLFTWNRRSRLLHAQGLKQVLKWLQEIKEHNWDSQDEADLKISKSRAQLLCSCWKHYSILLHLEDHNFSKHSNELLNQYLLGIQYYTEHQSEGNYGTNISGTETIMFFLNCLCLLLGRVEEKNFESLMSEFGIQLVHILLIQLHSHNEDVIEGVVCIIKATILRQNCTSAGSHINTREMDALVSSLLHLLDETDGTAKAAVLLIAEYYMIHADSHCLNEVLERLASGNIVQRRNAIDVLSEIISLSQDSVNVLSHIKWEEIANCLLPCLGDEESAVVEQTLNLLTLIDPALVLPLLVDLIYSSDGKLQSSANDALLRVLKYHNENSDVICKLLDCLSNLNEGPEDTPKSAGSGTGSKLDSDQVLKLIPEWSKSVQNWNSLIGTVIDKMFAEPSNATVVRFLTYINEQLAEAADIVLQRVLLQMKGQKEIDESSLSRWANGTCTSEHRELMELNLFAHLCPLLVLRLLPLRVFNDLKSSFMYGQLIREGILSDSKYKGINSIDKESVAALLLHRAFSKFEFEEVQRLSAEICGRIHPQVLYPIICSHLQHYVDFRDIRMIRSCLFSLCTSLVVRAEDSYPHLAILEIINVLDRILLWPSLGGDEISKAQHGCIDCIALAICAELQFLITSKGSTTEKSNFTEKGVNAGIHALRKSVLTYVVCHLVQDQSEISFTFKLGSEVPPVEMPIPISFRLCMANVLISACQKIFDSGKRLLAQKTLPRLIGSIEGLVQPELRAACIQVMFTAVYHLKSAVVPYSSDLLKLSLRFLENGYEKERIAGAKLLASLMASEDAVLESISERLLETRSILLKVSSTDGSANVRQLCSKLLECVTCI